VSAAKSPAHIAPGVAEIRLSGMPADVDAVVSVLERFAAGLPVETMRLKILTRSTGRRNRRSPGHRVYLVVRLEPRRAMGENQ